MTYSASDKQFYFTRTIWGCIIVPDWSSPLAASSVSRSSDACAMKTFCLPAMTVLGSLLLTMHPAQAVTQQSGARGGINRMIVNHNANNNEIFITTTDPAPLCPAMTLRTNDPNVSDTSFKTLYSYLLAAKLAGKTLEFYTDPSCNLFRAEIVD